MSAGEIDLGAEMAREPRPRVAKRVAVRHDVRVRLAPAESIARDLADTVRRITQVFGGELVRSNGRNIQGGVR